jgi:hypothetical protein
MKFLKASMLARVFGCAIICALALFALVFPDHSVSMADTASPFKVEMLPSPAGASSSEPQFTGESGRVVLSWMETRGPHATLKFATPSASGWAAAKTAITGANLYVNSFDVPAVRQLADGTLVAQWLVSSGDDPDSDAYDIRLSVSHDQGRTWSHAMSPHHDGTKTEHGFVSIFEPQGSGFGLVWLDGRATDPEKETGDMALRASLFDAQGKQLKDMVVSSRVCECCSTSAAQTSNGVIVAYRNRSKDEIRDIYTSRFSGGQWSTGTPVHNDGWQIKACPINGPSINARGNKVAVGWFTGKDNQGRAFVAFSNDGGKTFGAPTRVDDASSGGRLAVQLLEDDSAAVMWVENANGHSLLDFRTVTPGGQRSAAITISKTAGGVPRLAYDGKDLLFSWTDGKEGAAHIQTARVAMKGK